MRRETSKKSSQITVVDVDGGRKHTQTMSTITADTLSKRHNHQHSQSKKQSIKAAKLTRDQEQLEAMLYGAEQWNKSPNKHNFRNRQRTREMTKTEFVPYKQMKKTTVPQFNGTFEAVQNEAVVQKRPYRPSTTNQQTTTDSQYYLRSRKRNGEKQTAFLKTKNYQDDCQRVQDQINERPKVAFEPFDKKAFANHRFRDRIPAKWTSNGDFMLSSKVAKQTNTLMHQNATAEPYQDGCEAIGMELMVRVRETDREIAPVDFNNLVKAEGRQEAFLSKTANNGSLRQLNNLNTRNLLRKYEDDADGPSTIANSSYIKAYTLAGKRDQKETMSAKNLEIMLDAIKNENETGQLSKAISITGGGDLNKSLDVISERKSKQKEGKKTMQTYQSNSQEQLLPQHQSQQTFAQKDGQVLGQQNADRDPTGKFNQVSSQQTIAADEIDGGEVCEMDTQRSVSFLAKRSKNITPSDNSHLDHVGSIQLKARKSSASRKRPGTMKSPLTTNGQPTIDSTVHERFYPNSNKTALSNLRSKLSAKNASTFEDTWDNLGRNIKTQAVTLKNEDPDQDYGRYSQLYSATPTMQIVAEGTIATMRKSMQSIEVNAKPALNHFFQQFPTRQNLPNRRISQDGGPNTAKDLQAQTSEMNQYTQLTNNVLTNVKLGLASNTQIATKKPPGKMTDDLASRLMKTQSQRQFKKNEGRISPFARPASITDCREQSRPVSSYMIGKHPNYQRIGSGDVYNNQYGGNRARNLCQAVKDSYAANNKSNGGPTFNSDASGVALTTVQQKATKASDVSTQNSRPQSGKPAALRLRQLIPDGQSAVSNNLFHIDINQSSKGDLYTDVTPLRQRLGERVAPVTAANANTIQIGGGLMHRKKNRRTDTISQKRHQLFNGNPFQTTLGVTQKIGETSPAHKLLTSSYMRHGSHLRGADFGEARREKE